MSKSLIQVLKESNGSKYSGKLVYNEFQVSERGMLERRLAQLRADDLTLDLLKAHDSQIPSIINPTPSTADVVQGQLVINQFIGS